MINLKLAGYLIKLCEREAAATRWDTRLIVSGFTIGIVAGIILLALGAN